MGRTSNAVGLKPHQPPGEPAPDRELWKILVIAIVAAILLGLATIAAMTMTTG